jgi:hypothetical protein
VFFYEFRPALFMQVWRVASPADQDMLQEQLLMKLANSKSLAPELQRLSECNLVVIEQSGAGRGLGSNGKHLLQANYGTLDGISGETSNASLSMTVLPCMRHQVV